MQSPALHINIYNLKSITESNRLKDFASFLYLKSLYSNSCILNYTQVSLAKKAKLSPGTIKRLVKSFLNSGWCRMHKTSLVFNKLKSFDHYKAKHIVKFHINKDSKQVLRDLQLIILKQKQSDFDNLYQLSSDLRKPQSLFAHKKALRRVKKHNIDVKKLPGEGDMLSMSMVKIGQLLGCSCGSAAGIIKDLKKSQMVWCVRSREYIGPASHPMEIKTMLEDFPNSYYYKGGIYSVMCNKYKF